MSVLVVVEQTAGVLHPMSREAIAAGRKAADESGGPLRIAVLGRGVETLAERCAAARCDEVLALDHERLERYTADGYAAALRATIDEIQPDLTIFPHTYEVRDYAPKLAARFGRPLVSDVIGLRFEEGQTIFIRQLFQGKLQADVVCEGEGPCFASIQSGSFAADDVDLDSGAASAPIRRMEPSPAPEMIRVRPLDRFQETKSAVDLSAAPIIVAIGRGIKGPENIPLAEKLAAALGGELAASRPICDNGWLPIERQVGSSGQTVAPKLYLALGISGAIQHVVGMKGSKTIVAVNKDESAPIFEIADYGVKADLFEFVPALLDALSAE